MKVQSVTHKRGYAQIAEQIIELIRRGELKPGERLPSEREMAQLFDTSRPTVREARSALELAGVVEIRVGKGVFVLGLGSYSDSPVLGTLKDEVAPTDLLEAREMLEPFTARHAALRAEQVDLKAIAETLGACHSAVEADDPDAFERADDQFHLAISRAAHNRALTQFANEISLMRSGRLWRAMKQQLALGVSQLHRYCQEHTAIYDAIRDGHAEEASDANARHLQTVRRHLLEEETDE